MGAVTEEPLTVHQAFHFCIRHSSSGQPGDNGSDNGKGGDAVSSQEVGQYGFLSLGDDLSRGFPPTQERPKLFSSPSRRLNLIQPLFIDLLNTYYV